LDNDFIARVGKDNEGRNKINGHRLCDLCEENTLAFGGTLILVMALCAEERDEDFVSE